LARAVAVHAILSREGFLKRTVRAQPRRTASERCGQGGLEGRFERYRRMRRHVHRVRDHLLAVIETNHEESLLFDRDNYLASSLCHCAHFLVDLDEFFVEMADAVSSMNCGSRTRSTSVVAHSSDHW
jgi:hypothetical protein